MKGEREAGHDADGGEGRDGTPEKGGNGDMGGAARETPGGRDAAYVPIGAKPPRTTPPWWHGRRLLRGRWRPAVAAAVAGVLLGVTGTAWQTGSGPFAADDRCWGVLGADDLAPVFEHREGDVGVHELPLTRDSRGIDGPAGTCRVSTPGWAVTARVHRLDDTYDGGGRWSQEFLSSRLSPLGGGLLGMASDTRAWLAVPDGCFGRPHDFEGPVVADISMGSADPRMDVDTKARAVLARSVVRIVNGMLADEGCAGTIADPSGRLPRPSRPLDEKPGALCGIEGLRYRSEAEAFRHSPTVTAGAGPVRTCERGVLSDFELRMMTVTDPRIAEIFAGLALHGGERVHGAHGYGSLRADLGVFKAECQTGGVVFLVRFDGRYADDVRGLFGRYVRAESERLACGDQKLSF
ncbi:hypothetical protein ACFY93_17775 [Streptomyces sp. NPDC008313]|uniref:hypothetical protein n=1 Tax=Streptomyces sp. NPDC008313 TaxID=3364826 RepID=UPI0036EFD612